MLVLEVLFYLAHKHQNSEEEWPGDWQAILERIARSLSDMDYQDYVQHVIAGGGQWGENSAIGSMEPVNIIPKTGNIRQSHFNTNKMTNCNDGLQSNITLAFITGRDSRRKTSFKKVMKNLRDQLSQSHDQSVVFVISDIWDMKLLEKNLLDFEEYKSQSQKFVFLLSHGRTLTPIDMSR